MPETSLGNELLQLLFVRDAGLCLFSRAYFKLLLQSRNMVFLKQARLFIQQQSTEVAQPQARACGLFPSFASVFLFIAALTLSSRSSASCYRADPDNFAHAEQHIGIQIIWINLFEVLLL